jgi:hypothetical protein
MNERGYWTLKEEYITHQFDESLCNAIITVCNNQNIKSIVDIGCGNGSYVQYFNDSGFNCWGYDGSPMTPDFCKVQDFSDRVNIGKFGLVLSLEVGEHIPEDYEQIFLDNLVSASINLIIFSWAVEGQGGDGHVNCKNNDYVIRQMADRGYDFDKETTDFLRDKCSIPWFKYTLMTFEI